MGLEHEVLLIQKTLIQISASSDGSRTEEALDLLEALQRLDIDLDMLVKTRIGRTVNELRRSGQDHNVITLSKILLKKWKRFLSSPSPADPATASASDPANCTAAANESSNTSQSSSSSYEKSGCSSSSSSSSGVKCEEKIPVHLGGMTDAVRLKCREMLTAALKVGPVAEGCAEPEQKAAELEEVIYSEFNKTDTRYKNRIRSRVSNLKDPKNPGLSSHFLCGAISAGQLAKMTPEEMASEELKKLREKFVREAINAAQLAIVQETTADVFDCDNCDNCEQPSSP
ncbi:transcription elongation factor S-II-like [Drosophila obscura]|uniref:transcription elongation factor S-II-like n=1 Tax=Drosophila obscura TaxID=7282 RepID=UPI001BB1EDC9|nr:transcription elongation factor S-II-like [Drosophila obscura]